MPARRNITFRSQLELCRAFALGRKSGKHGPLSIHGDKLAYKKRGRFAVVVARRNWDAFFSTDRPHYALVPSDEVPLTITNKVRKSFKELGLRYDEIPLRK